MGSYAIDESPEGRAHLGRVSYWGHSAYRDSAYSGRHSSGVSGVTGARERTSDPVAVARNYAAKVTSRSWAGRRPEPRLTDAVLVSSILNMPLSPRLRRLVEASLASGGDLVTGSAVAGMTVAAMHKELALLRKLMVAYGLAEMPAEVAA